jgi:nitrite reductase/ring-hydroxylating ferredoxin subunit
MSEEAQDWREVATLGDVPENDVIQVRLGETCIALFNLDGRHYATSGICTHAHAFLA